MGRYISVDVEVDVYDVLESLEDHEIVEILGERKGSELALPVATGSGPGDPPPSRYVEAAFLAAKALPDCPPAIKDLFWHVFGRAL